MTVTDGVDSIRAEAVTSAGGQLDVSASVHDRTIS
jgi:hypothetical protein